MKKRVLLLLATMQIAASTTVYAEERIDYHGELTGTVASGDFAPFYMSSLRHGTLSSSDNLLLGVSVSHEMDATRRFSYDYGVSAYAGISSGVPYMQYDATTADWSNRSLHPSRVWLQQLYAGVKYRSVFLTLGMKNTHSPILNETLTSGDLIESGNARPLPGARAGFIEFQDIPFTDGWVQIDGEVFYGKYTDSDWWEEHFNRYSGHVTSGQYAVYRRCYFRTKPEKPLSVTVGVQCASQFGGDTRYYRRGNIYKTDNHPAKFKDFIKMFWPVEDGSEGFIQGNTVGSWDLMARYRLRDDSQMKFYFQWPWEDGSGMGKLNGFDGLWGIEYDFAPTSAWVKGVAFEYLDLTNQSGPMHWDPDDNPGTDINYRAEGADDYYNNVRYNSYASYGLAMGSPMVMSPLYNRDGYMQFVGNRMRGVHLAVAGRIADCVDYRVKVGHRKAWGNGKMQLPEPISATSLMIEGAYSFPQVKGLSLKGMFALDSGDMPCKSAGALVTVSYDGFLTLGK